jgi:carotenoid 1,2-hydratase
VKKNDCEGFNAPIPPSGYAWWYFDALSDDGQRAFTAILFIGSVFSPAYAARLRRGESARAEEHVAVNLALYEGGHQISWVMSEYGAHELKGVDAHGPTIGATHVERLANGTLRLHIRDRSAPFLLSLAKAGRPVEGTIDLEPLGPTLGPFELSSAGGQRHRWRVPMPRARVKVNFTKPAFSFEGTGYHDLNRGDGRLEAAFSRWSWARFHVGDRTLVLYALKERGGESQALLVDSRRDDILPDDASLLVDATEGPPRKAGWGLTLPSWFEVDRGGTPLKAEPTQLLETAPFYARYVATLSDGKNTLATGLGEYLDLDRFRSSRIQFLLRFKTRRVS